jgi:formate dehydrogenase subunit gamma
MSSEVVLYRRPTRILHWAHTGAFCVLFLTGIILFIPQLEGMAQGGLVRFIHRLGAAVFILAPLLYTLTEWKSVKTGIKLAFSWNADDLRWWKSAPRYYFLGQDTAVPQGRFNGGQRLAWLGTLTFGMVFLATGLTMWFFKTTAPPDLLRWFVFIHDISFIVSAPMFFLHVYLGLFHPTNTEAWRAISQGTVSAEYARSHYGKWYNEIAKGEQPPDWQ